MIAARCFVPGRAAADGLLAFVEDVAFTWRAAGFSACRPWTGAPIVELRWRALRPFYIDARVTLFTDSLLPREQLMGKDGVHLDRAVAIALEGTGDEDVALGWRTTSAILRAGRCMIVWLSDASFFPAGVTRLEKIAATRFTVRGELGYVLESPDLLAVLNLATMSDL